MLRPIAIQPETLPRDLVCSHCGASRRIERKDVAVEEQTTAGIGMYSAAEYIRPSPYEAHRRAISAPPSTYRPIGAGSPAATARAAREDQCCSVTRTPTTPIATAATAAIKVQKLY